MLSIIDTVARIVNASSYASKSNCKSLTLLFNTASTTPASTKILATSNNFLTSSVNSALSVSSDKNPNLTDLLEITLTTPPRTACNDSSSINSSAAFNPASTNSSETFNPFNEPVNSDTVACSLPVNTLTNALISSLAFTIVVISSANDTSAKLASVYSTSDPNCPNTWLANLAAK